MYVSVSILGYITSLNEYDSSTKKGKLPKKPPHPMCSRRKAKVSIAPTVSEEDTEDFRGDISGIKTDTEGEGLDGEDDE